MALIGSQAAILRAIYESQVDPAGYVSDVPVSGCIVDPRPKAANLTIGTEDEPPGTRRWNRGQAARHPEISPMTRPTPEPIDPRHVVDLAAKTMRAARFPFLATIDGDQPRVRPVSPVRTDGFAVYIANLRAYHKTVEIKANPRVELCYLDDGHDQVRVAGVAEVVTDPALLRAIWDENPLLRGYLGTIDNPELIVYRVMPERVRFMRDVALRVPRGADGARWGGTITTARKSRPSWDVVWMEEPPHANHRPVGHDCPPAAPTPSRCAV